MHAFFISILLLGTAYINPQFNPQTVRPFKGKIASVQTFSYATRPTPHIQILLKTMHGEMAVDLGPQWYIESQGIMLLQGEEVEGEGSFLTVNRTPFIIASSITIDHTTYPLREKSGKPLWQNPVR